MPGVRLNRWLAEIVEQHLKVWGQTGGIRALQKYVLIHNLLTLIFIIYVVKEIEQRD